MSKRGNSFTLIELLVVIAIIAILDGHVVSSTCAELREHISTVTQFTYYGEDTWPP